MRDKFREELRKPLSERYFSEDDLISLFDTAGDDFDDYLRTEALLLGARLYPDSFALLERRAIYYLDTDARVFEQFMADNANMSSTMLDILRLNLLAGFPIADIESEADRLLAGFERLEDEEVIRFVQGAKAVGLDEWLVRNIDLLRAKVAYVPTLLYEYAYQADESKALSTIAVKMLEELTELEPYVADYWTLLALAYIRDDRPDDASSAIDYSLAIDPDNSEALKAKLHLANAVKDEKTVHDIALKLLKLYPEDEGTIMLAVMLHSFDGEGFYKLVEMMQPVSYASRVFITSAITFNYPKLNDIFNTALDYGFTSETEWHAIADFAYDAGRLDVVNDIMRIYEKKMGVALNHEFLNYRILFDLGNYPLVAHIFAESRPTDTLRQPDKLFQSYSIFLVSLLRMGEIGSARIAAETLLAKLEEDAGYFGSPLEEHGMKQHLNDILKKIKSKKPTDWNKFKPII